MDALPPSPPATYAYAPGDIYPRTPRERELCAAASDPDWLYLAGLVALDTGAIWFGSTDTVKYSASVPLRIAGPAVVGVTWGATVGGAWLALPKCSLHWVDEPPLEGDVRATWPLALSLALVAASTAPIVNAIAIGSNLPLEWSNFERVMHVVAAGVAGFGGALLPYLLPPRTWRAAREIERIRFGATPGGGVYLGYTAAF
jgi:hypothetical protein